MTCHHITVVWSCNVALWVKVWDISLLCDEWQICLNIRLWPPSDLICIASASQSQAEPDCPPIRLCDFHTERETVYWRKILALKRQCGWDYSLFMIQKRPLPHHQQLLSSECETPHLSSTHHQCVVLVWHKETATWIENCTTLYCRMTINGNWTLNHMWKMTAFSCLFPKSQSYYITWCSGNMNTVLAERADTTYSDNSDTSGMTKSPKCFNISLPPTTILNMTMLHTHTHKGSFT